MLLADMPDVTEVVSITGMLSSVLGYLATACAVMMALLLGVHLLMALMGWVGVGSNGWGGGKG